MSADIPTVEDMLYLMHWYHAGCPAGVIRHGAYREGLHPEVAVKILGRLIEAWNTYKLVDLKEWPKDADAK